MLGTVPDQVGVVVDDLEQALAAHSGLGPWLVYTYDRERVPNLSADGGSISFGFRLALNPSQPQIELIQPLDRVGPHGRWLARNGSGIQHLGYLVDDVAAATGQMEEAGFRTILSGSGYGAEGGGAFAYFDTVAAVGYLMEAIERPERRTEPESTRP